MALEQAGLQFIAENVAVYISNVNNASKANEGFYKTLDDGAGHAGGFEQVITGALRHIGTLAVDALGQAAKAVGGFVKDSVGLAGDFQQGMLEFQSVAGKDVDASGLEEFHDLFLQLGKDLPVSTSDVQQAAIEMVKGGIDPAIVAAGGLKQNIQFAAAAMKGDLAGAATVSAKILGGWSDANATASEQAAFLTHATDQLTKAANASSVDVKELSLGIFNSQGIAKAAGVTFDDLTTTLAELAPRFASSSEAGTSLKNLIVRLNPQTKSATGAMEGLGLYTEATGSAFYDAKGNFVGMQKASQLLQNSLKGLTKEQQATALQTIFGNDAMSAASALAELGANGYANMAAKLDKANGVQAAAALIQQSFNTKVDNAKGSLETLQLIIGERLLPVLGSLLDNYITPGINTITEWATAIFKANDPLVALSNDIDSILPGFNEFASFVEKLSSALGAGDWSGAFDTITQGLSDLGDTIGPPLIEALDTGVQMAFDWIVQQAPEWLDQLSVWGEQLADFVTPYIPPMLSALGDAVGQAWAWVQQQAPGWLDQLGAWGEQFGAWIAPYIPQAIDALGGLVSDAWAWVKDQAPGWLEQLQTWGEELVAWIAPMIPPMLAELGTLGQSFLDWIGEQAAPLLTKFQAWGESFVAWVVPATVKFLAEWPKMFESFLDWIGREAGPLLAKFGEWAISVVAWIAPMIPGFLLALGGVATAALVFIGETTAVLAKKVLEWGAVMTGWVLAEVVLKLPGILESVGKVLADWSVKTRDWLGQQMIKAGTSLVEGIIKGVKDKASALYQALIDMGSHAFDEFMKGIKGGSPALVFVPGGESVVQGIMLGMQNMLPGLLGVVDMMGAALKDKFKKITEQQSDQVEQMVEDLQGKLGGIQGMLTGLQGAGFMSTANIDRQKAANLSAMDELNAHAKGIAQQQLADAAKIAATLNDPQQQAEYFEARSKAILEMASLQDTLDRQLSGQQRADLEQTVASIKDRMDETTNDIERQSLQQLLNRDQSMLDVPQLTASQISTLQQQIALINDAQINEGRGQSLDMSQGSQTSDLARALQDFFAQAGSAQWKDTFPGLMENDNVRALSGMLDRLMAAQVQPTSAAQLAASGTAGQYNIGHQGNVYSMPIYTNNSPGALQQSFAVMQAMNP